MSILEALLYGVVQGITEYLPVSSSAHLILLPKFLSHEDPGLAFDVFLHLGTLLSTLIYFWKDWLRVAATLPAVGAPLKQKLFPKGLPVESLDWKYVVIGTIPALIAGAALHGYISTVFRGAAVLAWTLPLGGIVLFLVDHFLPRAREFKSLTIKDAVLVGVAQCFALIPGVSRSGSTITGGRLLGLDRQAAARFSFLLSAPVVAAATVFEMRHWDELFTSSIGVVPLITAAVGAFVSGWLAIGGLLHVLRRFGYLSFAVYRVALGLLIYAVLL